MESILGVFGGHENKPIVGSCSPDDDDGALGRSPEGTQRVAVTARGE